MVSLGMLFDVPKAKNTVLAARIFLRISTVSQHPACLDHVIQTRKTIKYFFRTEYMGEGRRGEERRGEERG